MADVWVLALVAVFFSACVALVRGCDRILGDDESLDLGTREPIDAEIVEPEPVGPGR
jgi:hypothetical protein